jgi:hypothetical protein
LSPTPGDRSGSGFGTRQLLSAQFGYLGSADEAREERFAENEALVTVLNRSIPAGGLSVPIEH